MKTEEPAKFFKRKTTSMKLMPFQERSLQQTESGNTGAKYLSPKSISGLDCGMYKKQESLVKVLQQQVNKLKDQVSQLQCSNASLLEQNKILKDKILQQDQNQKFNIDERFATADVLNELKEKIELLSDDDQLSTYDDIELSDVCHCQQYEKQLKETKDKVKFLEESLLHSQQIIIKLQVETKKLKFYLVSKHASASHDKSSRNDHRSIKEKENKVKYRISSIEELVEDNEE